MFDMADAENTETDADVDSLNWGDKDDDGSDVGIFLNNSINCHKNRCIF
jgi:hypothetical protein